MSKNSTRRVIAVAAAAGIAISTLAFAQSAEAQAPARKRCTAGLATGIMWDHTDPQYMKLVPTVQWKNCRGAIRQVVMETRMIDKVGGLEDTTTLTFTADVVHLPNGTQAYSNPQYVYGSYYSSGSAEFLSSPSGGALKSCTQRADGEQSVAMTGVTFYNVARAYDRSNRVILEKISPPVVCDQPG